jgi:hypothetical protein
LGGAAISVRASPFLLFAFPKRPPKTPPRLGAMFCSSETKNWVRGRPPSGFTFFRPVDSRSFTLNLITLYFFFSKKKKKAKQKELFLEPLSSTEAPPPRQAHPWPLCEAGRTQRAAIPAGGLVRRKAERVQSAPEGRFSQA